MNSIIIRKILLSPWAIITGMVCGMVIGIYFKSYAQYISPFGKIYISILKMSVIPIMASAVVVSLSKLLRSEETSRYIYKILTVFLLFTVFISLLGILVGILSVPIIGNDTAMKKSVGRIMLARGDSEEVKKRRELTLSVKEIDTRFYEKEESENQRLGEFLMSVIPENIFSALSKGENLKIIFFFITVGVMMKFVKEKYNEYIVGSFEGIYQVFQKLINLAMYFLPFGLCALMAQQFADMGFGVLISLIKLIILVYVASFVVIFASSLVLWKKSERSYTYQFVALKDAIMVTIGTRSSFATLPLAISGMVENLKFKKDMSKLTISLGLTLCKHGKTMLFCISAVFAATIYDFDLNLVSIVIILISSIFAGMAVSGAPSIVSRGMISMVLAPLGIPDGAIIAILLTIDPIIDPVITLVSTYPNYAASAVISGLEQPGSE